MNYSTFFTFFQLIIILSLNNQILSIEFLAWHAFSFIGSSYVIRSHIPELYISKIYAGESSTTNFFYQTFIHFILCFDVVQNIAIFIRIVWLLHHWQLNPLFYFPFLFFANLKLKTLIRKVILFAALIEKDRLKLFLEGNIMFFEVIYRIVLFLKLTQKKLLLMSWLWTYIEKHVNNFWIFMKDAEVFFSKLTSIVQSWRDYFIITDFWYHLESIVKTF